ncbi:hypothetical protein HW571_21695 [Agrobacterium genomosp. 3]|uniref:hypothetical protein n=1 Tax=Agrobacterium tomkonis TaxID=1183410 RepID=UPI001CD8E6C9|nr:hypothetical protein [Agrobacterium tomkonis]MCA1878721.1 hypothetical protein [Agrobacterium tumefaciens]MCA1893946.1 hypothetical protein [Agrobacterium tomkonis]
MPAYKIETTYHLPVYRQRSYEADTLEEACRAAVADKGWEDGEEDVDTSGETYVSGIWDGANASYAGASIPVPSQFDDVTQRRARHFEILLGLLKILLHGAHTAQPSSPDWLARSAWAIARGEAILARAPDPQEPLDVPKATHVLARLQEHQVRDAVAAILEVDPSFELLSSAAVTDDDVHSACLTIASTIDLSDAVGNAEFLAAMAAIRTAYERAHRG